ncbi:MAG: hypothetical protein JO076_12815 [Verrucomicrobia bacterium]|nr:hypothetical protein [Verrucomicrobiota bacterium]
MSPLTLATCRFGGRNRQFKNKTTYHPPPKAGSGFFGLPLVNGETRIMTIEELTQEQKLALLADLYLELNLPLQDARTAAKADLVQLEDWKTIEEAA